MTKEIGKIHTENFNREAEIVAVLPDFTLFLKLGTIIGFNAVLKVFKLRVIIIYKDNSSIDFETVLTGKTKHEMIYVQSQVRKRKVINLDERKTFGKMISEEECETNIQGLIQDAFT
jgi:hypothetical protein